jgi:hypothetical protein
MVSELYASIFNKWASRKELHVSNVIGEIKYDES